VIHDTAFIHPKAHVEGATIGARSKVWQFASVIRGTVLGEDCQVGAAANLDGPVFGDRCIISPGVIMGPGFVVGNDVFIGPNVTVCNDVWPAVHKQGFDLDGFRNGFVTVLIKDGAAIGANAVILPGVVVGGGATVAAGSVVSANVPDGGLWTRKGAAIPSSAVCKSDRMRAVSW
jgi:acetyltransferase-like isoleucine patch superfamily enzyme